MSSPTSGMSFVAHQNSSPSLQPFALAPDPARSRAQTETGSLPDGSPVSVTSYIPVHIPPPIALLPPSVAERQDSLEDRMNFLEQLVQQLEHRIAQQQLQISMLRDTFRQPQVPISAAASVQAPQTIASADQGDYGDEYGLPFDLH